MDPFRNFWKSSSTSSPTSWHTSTIYWPSPNTTNNNWRYCISCLFKYNNMGWKSICQNPHSAYGRLNTWDSKSIKKEHSPEQTNWKWSLQLSHHKMSLRSNNSWACATSSDHTSETLLSWQHLWHNSQEENLLGKMDPCQNQQPRLIENPRRFWYLSPWYTTQMISCHMPWSRMPAKEMRSNLQDMELS